MKLILDNNLSHNLISRLKDLFPDSTHVMIEGLDEADDLKIWNFAKENGFTIITKDSDYSDLSILKGFPPKVIWLRIGNCKVHDLASIISDNVTLLNNFDNDSTIGIIEID